MGVIFAAADWQEPLCFRGSRGDCGSEPVPPAPLHAASCHTPVRTRQTWLAAVMQVAAAVAGFGALPAPGLAAGPCEVAAAIHCGQTVTGSTAGAQNLVQDYSCTPWPKEAPEVAYAFLSKTDDLVEVTLASEPWSGLTLFAVEQQCDGQQCLASALSSMLLQVSAGVEYYFLVDAESPPGLDFTLSLKCQSGCIPACGDKECGDDGCLGTCGSCAPGTACVDGACKKNNGCVKWDLAGCGHCPCESCVCDMDPLCCTAAWDTYCANECEQYCGGCEALETCGDGACSPDDWETCANCPADCACVLPSKCVDAACCTPYCQGKVCGPDGCGALCGPCAAGTVCTDDATACVPQDGCFAWEEAGCPDCACEECVCTQDPWCCQYLWDAWCAGQCKDACGGCFLLWGCGDGVCLPAKGEDCAACPADCGCNEGQVCAEHACCTPACAGKECGKDGCGGTCGTCPEGELCVSDTCFCKKQCGGKECGPDGCDGYCGTGDPATQGCPQFEPVCLLPGGTCVKEDCSPACAGRECGPDGCGGSCGACPPACTCGPTGLCLGCQEDAVGQDVLPEVTDTGDATAPDAAPHSDAGADPQATADAPTALQDTAAAPDGVGADASPAPSGGSKGAGCGCAAAGAPPRVPWALLAAAALLVLRLRHRS
jgi:hypothetical protein